MKNHKFKTGCSLKLRELRGTTIVVQLLRSHIAFANESDLRSYEWSNWSSCKESPEQILRLQRDSTAHVLRDMTDAMLYQLSYEASLAWEWIRLNSVEAPEFFLDFLCNCFSCFITARITFTGIFYGFPNSYGIRTKRNTIVFTWFPAEQSVIDHRVAAYRKSRMRNWFRTSCFIYYLLRLIIKYNSGVFSSWRRSATLGIPLYFQ